MSSASVDVNAMVQGIRELGLGFNDQDIKTALKKFDFSQERATNYLLEVSMSGQGSSNPVS